MWRVEEVDTELKVGVAKFVDFVCLVAIVGVLFFYW